MKDMDLQSSMSLILPPPNEDAVSSYLSAVSRAVGARSDAAFARVIGQPAHVLANWRRRKRIPDEHISWFATSFVEKMGTYNVHLPDVGLTAKAAVIRILVKCEGNPVAAVRNVGDANGFALGGLLAMAQYIVDASHIHELEEPDADYIAELMRPLMCAFSNADQLRAYRG